MPFLVLDTPAQAEGLAVGLVETTAEPPAVDETDEDDETVFPDIAQLAELASNFRTAQNQVVESQQEEDREAAAQAASAELDAAIERSLLLGTQVAAELEAERAEAERVEAERVAAEHAAAEAAAEAERAAAEQAAAAEAQATAEAAAPAPAPEAAAAPADTSGPVPPAQVNGRVPPPAGGPTAAQWDQVRNCESTHNYAAVNPSGKFRGAYQFSRQTWDWVAGVHHPHLVGVDPAAADPAWQDVMAYTLHEMSGPGQWPECGRFLN